MLAWLQKAQRATLPLFFSFFCFFYDKIAKGWGLGGLAPNQADFGLGKEVTHRLALRRLLGRFLEQCILVGPYLFKELLSYNNVIQDCIDVDPPPSA